MENQSIEPLVKNKVAKEAAACCTPKNNGSACCTPSRDKEENGGACCAQPADGSACCNK